MKSSERSCDQFDEHDDVTQSNESGYHNMMESKGGQGEIRTRGLYHAKVTIFQLIYLPSKIDDRIIIYKDFYGPAVHRTIGSGFRNPV